MFFPQIFSAVGSSSRVKLQVTVCNIKVSSVVAGGGPSKNLTAHVFRKIFAITDPASNILQSEQIDLFIAVGLVETAEGRLPRMRSNYTKVLPETKESVAGTNSAARFSSKTFHEKEEGE